MLRLEHRRGILRVLYMPGEYGAICEALRPRLMWLSFHVLPMSASRERQALEEPDSMVTPPPKMNSSKVLFDV